MQDGVGEHQDEAHEELRQHVGEHVAHRDAYPAAASQLARAAATIGELSCTCMHLGAHDAREAGPVRQRDADRHAARTRLPQRVRDQDEQHDVGHAHHQVDEPCDGRVDAC